MFNILCCVGVGVKALCLLKVIRLSMGMLQGSRYANCAKHVDSQKPLKIMKSSPVSFQD